MPGVEKVTAPGVALVLVFGVPPGTTHEYCVTVPSGSVPVPAKVTDCPALIVTSAAGFVIVPFGGWLLGVGDIWTHAATDGTPLRLDRKSTRLNSSHSQISYAVFCLKKKKQPLRRPVRHADRPESHHGPPVAGHGAPLRADQAALPVLLAALPTDAQFCADPHLPCRH